MEELQKALADSFNDHCKALTNKDLTEWGINLNVYEDQKMIFSKYNFIGRSNHTITRKNLDKALFTAISSAIVIYKANLTGEFSLNEFRQLFRLTSGMSPNYLKIYILFWRNYLLLLRDILAEHRYVSGINDYGILQLLNKDVRDIIRTEIILTENTLR